MARRRARLTQRELASRLGCRQATIARWERGDRQPAFEDVQDVVGACGLQLDAHLVPEDHSWWPQIAAQLGRTPTERVCSLTTPDAPVDPVAVLKALADIDAPAIVIGEVAGALHGWPLVLSRRPTEICAKGDEEAVAPALLSDARVVAIPAGTSGYGDLARSAETIDVDGSPVRVAGLLDLLRIADASPDPDARRHALAYQAVLDVQHAQGEPRPAVRPTDEERVEAWLSKQTPVA